jgi:hypothetical protein
VMVMEGGERVVVGAPVDDTCVAEMVIEREGMDGEDVDCVHGTSQLDVICNVHARWCK